MRSRSKWFHLLLFNEHERVQRPRMVSKGPKSLCTMLRSEGRLRFAPAILLSLRRVELVQENRNHVIVVGARIIDEFLETRIECGVIFGRDLQLQNADGLVDR
jgi:hypothetical protein